MQGKVKVKSNEEEESINISTLAFLKKGISNSARTFLETLMDNIVQSFIYKIHNLLNIPLPKEDSMISPDKAFFEQLGCLTVLLKNFPEISPIILSYELGDYQFPEGYNNYLPQWKPKETFLSFLIKYGSYVYNHSLVFIFEYFVKENETPIFIDYNGEVLLLSTYNEVFIIKEIISQLEGTFNTSEPFLKTMYARAIWSILPYVSIRILNLGSEPGQKHYKLTFIEDLKILCHKALNTYFIQNKRATSEKDDPTDVDDFDEEEMQVIYLFLARVMETEVVLKTRAELIRNGDFPKDLITSKEKLKWVSSLLKEKSYIGNDFSFTRDSVDVLPLIPNETVSKEIEIFNNYPNKDFSVDHGYLLSKFFLIKSKLMFRENERYFPK